jgi:tRNA(Ile)-lysidine synthetase-like protein
MIKLLIPIPQQIYLACSGGVDSIGAITFLTNRGRRNITPVFFDHDTETSKKALAFLLDQGYDPIVGHISRSKDKKESWEEYWRNERYKFFSSLEKDIITCHHLDDAIESWIFSCINGEGKVIPYKKPLYVGYVLRPFLITPKEELKKICLQEKKEWIEDETNNDLSYARNRIRHVILPEVLKINKGIAKVIRKKYIDLVEKDKDFLEAMGKATMLAHCP